MDTTTHDDTYAQARDLLARIPEGLDPNVIVFGDRTASIRCGVYRYRSPEVDYTQALADMVDAFGAPDIQPDGGTAWRLVWKPAPHLTVEAHGTAIAEHLDTPTPPVPQLRLTTAVA